MRKGTPVATTPETWRWTEAHGRLLRQKRLDKRISQKEAAALLRVTDDTLRNWENGETRPRDESLGALAEFCDISLAQLMAPEPLVPSVSAAPPPIEEGDRTVPSASRRKVAKGLFLGIVLVSALSAVGAFLWWRATTFKELVPLADGVEARNRSGKVLWRALGVDPGIAERSVLVRTPGGRKLLACVFAKPSEFRPEVVSTLSLLEPNARHVEVVQRIALPPMGGKYFPAYARRYDLAYINAVDLDGDGVDEILATYQQVPECVSYTVLYEPSIGRARVVFVQTGAHHFVGAWDVDGDGHKELFFLGINNGYDWMNALAGIRVARWLGKPLTSDVTPVYSPDSAAYVPIESATVFYALLPRGRVPDDPAAVSWDLDRRVISVALSNGRRITLSPLGFQLASRSAVPEAQRAVFRREAYRHDRESRRLSRAGFWQDATQESREAVSSAERAGDDILTESMQRDLAQIFIKAGHAEEGKELVTTLAAHSENASEIFYDAAVAFHLAGDLRRAVECYEAGIRRGGSPEAGKSKHEFIQGEILALVELGAFRQAGEAIDRVRDRYVTEDNDWTPMYREFVHWRAGELPHPERIDLPLNATDLRRYWKLEFRNAGGDDASLLLGAVELLLAEGNQPTGAILSLRAVLLERMGRHTEAVVAAQEALSLGTMEAKSDIRARGHMQLIAERYNEVTRLRSHRG
jgi:transcriptional regulator with XRE-family HTH domain/tetratricopeptide (TPR) repeat protein